MPAIPTEPPPPAQGPPPLDPDPLAPWRHLAASYAAELAARASLRRAQAVYLDAVAFGREPGAAVALQRATERLCDAEAATTGALARCPDHRVHPAVVEAELAAQALRVSRDG